MSWATRAAADPYFTRPQVEELVRSYLGDCDPADPMASPLYENLAGLPPIRVHVGGDEMLLDDSRRYVERAVAAGVDARVDVWKGMAHGHCRVKPAKLLKRLLSSSYSASHHRRCSGTEAMSDQVITGRCGNFFGMPRGRILHQLIATLYQGGRPTAGAGYRAVAASRRSRRGLAPWRVTALTLASRHSVTAGESCDGSTIGDVCDIAWL